MYEQYFDSVVISVNRIIKENQQTSTDWCSTIKRSGLFKDHDFVSISSNYLVFHAQHNKPTNA